MNRTALRTIEILEIISANDTGISLSQIVKLIGAPKTSVYDILRSLESCQAIYRREGDDPKYSIGFRSYIIGNTYKRTSHLLTNASAPTTNLVNTLKKTVILGKYYKEKLLIIDKKEPQLPVVVTPATGETMGIEDSALGIVIEAYSNNNFSIEHQKYNVQQTIARDGFFVMGVNEGQMTYSIAAPIFNFERKISGVVGIICFNYGEIDYVYEGKQIEGCASKISQNMGLNGGLYAVE